MFQYFRTDSSFSDGEGPAADLVQPGRLYTYSSSEDERIDTQCMLALVMVGKRFPRLGKVGAERTGSSVGRQKILGL